MPTPTSLSIRGSMTVLAMWLAQIDTFEGLSEVFQPELPCFLSNR